MQTGQVLPCITAHRQLIRTACTTSNAALQSSYSQNLACRVFQHRPALTLERAVGERAGLDNELWTQAPFVAGVVPDLPVISSWKHAGARLMRRCISRSVCPILAYLIQANTLQSSESKIIGVSCEQGCFRGALLTAGQWLHHRY